MAATHRPKDLRSMRSVKSYHVRLLRKFANAHLARRSRGILHIGAHEGSDEAGTYKGKNVIWIEANPELMNGLNHNIAASHRAFCALLGDRGQVVDFKIASN